MKKQAHKGDWAVLGPDYHQVCNVSDEKFSIIMFQHPDMRMDEYKGFCYNDEISEKIIKGQKLFGCGEKVFWGNIPYRVIHRMMQFGIDGNYHPAYYLIDEINYQALQKLSKKKHNTKEIEVILGAKTTKPINGNVLTSRMFPEYAAGDYIEYMSGNSKIDVSAAYIIDVKKDPIQGPIYVLDTIQSGKNIEIYEVRVLNKIGFDSKYAQEIPRALRIECFKIGDERIKVGDFFKSPHWKDQCFYATEIKNGRVYYYNGRQTARVSEPIEDLRPALVPTPAFKIGDKIKSSYSGDDPNEIGTVIAYRYDDKGTMDYIADTPKYKAYPFPDRWAVAADSPLGAVENTGDLMNSESDVYDAKSRLNLAPNKHIPESIIDKLRKEGLSLEDVDKLISNGFPIRKYKTQITIHGKCPTLTENRTTRGYVTLEKNDNESLGVRWRAIDEGKKYRILRDYLQWYGYQSDSNSQEFSFVKHIENQDESKDNEIATRLKEQFTKLLEAKVFFGGVSISKPVRKGWITMPYFYIKLSINGIYEKNIPRFVELVLNKDFATIEKEVAEAKADYEKRKKQRQDEYKKEEAERQAKEAKHKQQFDEQKAEWLKQNTSIPAGWEEIEYKPNEVFRTNDILHWYYAKISYEGTATDPSENCKMNVHDGYFVVKGSKGSFYLNECDSNGTITDRHHRQFPASARSNLRILRKLPVAKPAAASQPRPAAPAPSALFRKIDYSAKAIAVVGDTKPVKDELEDIGGKFNSHLSCGAGYIFSKAKSEAAVDEWVSRKNSEIILCKESEKI